MRNWTKNQIIISWIRHGKTRGNEEGRYIGCRLDEGLSECGKWEVQERMKAGYYPKADLILVSPMKRCLQTAQIIYGQENEVSSLLSVPYMEINEWREIDFGLFEGKNYQELNGNASYQAWIDSGGMLSFPDGESREEFITRCQRGFFTLIPKLEEMAEKLGENGVLHVSAVVHGGTIMALLSQFAGGNYFDYQCKNAEGYQSTMKFGKLESVSKDFYFS